MPRLPFIPILAVSLVLSACISLSPEPVYEGERTPSTVENKGQDVALYAMGLVDTGYRFGGKNPAAGLDCSGMVSYVFRNATGKQLSGSAADIARLGRPVARTRLLPGDLVFFNTLGRSHSHVGIYIGAERFVHAPNSGGRVRTESLATGWFADRFEEARRMLD